MLEGTQNMVLRVMKIVMAQFKRFQKRKILESIIETVLVIL